jgi:hypothetical protein
VAEKPAGSVCDGEEAELLRFCVHGGKAAALLGPVESRT